MGPERKSLVISDKEKLKGWINTVNNRYARMTFLKELNSINKSGSDALFNYIAKTPLIKGPALYDFLVAISISLANGSQVSLSEKSMPREFLRAGP